MRLQMELEHGLDNNHLVTVEERASLETLIREGKNDSLKSFLENIAIAENAISVASAPESADQDLVASLVSLHSAIKGIGANSHDLAGRIISRGEENITHFVDRVSVYNALSLNKNDKTILAVIMHSVAKDELCPVILTSLAVQCKGAALQGMLHGAFEETYASESLTAQEKDKLRDIQQALPAAMINYASSIQHPKTVDRASASNIVEWIAALVAMHAAFKSVAISGNHDLYKTIASDEEKAVENIVDKISVHNVLSLNENNETILAVIMRSVAKDELYPALLTNLAAQCKGAALQGMLSGAFEEAYASESLTAQEKDTLRAIQAALPKP